MKTNVKIAAGAVAGLIAGTMLMGSAFAAPRTTLTPPAGRYGMMGSVDASGTFQFPGFAQMQQFMNRYRTSSGVIDMNRMHDDVVSGRVVPPHMNRSGGPAAVPGAPSGRGMMRGVTRTPQAGMMGSVY